MIHPKKKTIALLGQKNKLSDSIKEIDTKKMVTLQQEGQNKIAIMGTTFVKPYILIQSHGDIECTKTSCISKIPDATFVPSLKAVQSTELSRRILNTFLSSHEGFLDKDIVKKKDKRFVSSTFKKTNRLTVNYLENIFSINIGNRNVIVDQFLIDPVVIESAHVNKEKSMVDVNLKSASCSIRKDFMSTPSRTVLFCSDDVTTSNAYELKSYLATYKEQLETARGLHLQNKPDRFNGAFNKSPRCHTSGKLVCCSHDDEQEFCY